jgi:hypothetical protein
MLSTRRGMLRCDKKDRIEWTNEEWGDVEADHARGRVRKIALSDELSTLDRDEE